MLERIHESPSRSASRGRIVVVLLLHALAVWLACAATMGVGMAVTSLDVTLVVHAVAAPVFAAIAAAHYFRRFGYTSPLATAAAVLGFVVLVDFFLVALVINGSLEMFRSVLGTWLPFALIFAATAGVGWGVRARS
jgi:hypothetical protein